MKSTSKMMVVAVVLMAAMLVLPAAAADRSITKNGDIIFDYENITLANVLNVNPALGEYSELAKYTDDDVKKGQITTISVTGTGAAKYIDLTQIDLEGNYGTYFPVYANGGANATYRIYVREPKVTLDVMLNNKVDSIVGKTVTKTTPIVFSVDAPQVGSVLGSTARVNIEITTPGGAKIKQIGTYANLSKQSLTGAKTYLPVANLTALEAGTYSAQATWDAPQGFADFAKDSNSVSFTVSTKDLSIAANKESVVRNNPFTVTITGDSKTKYFLFVKDASIPAAEYPTLKSGLAGVTPKGTTAFALGDVQNAVKDAVDLANKQRANSSSAYVDGTAAVVETNAAGVRTVEFSTTDKTNDKTYTIKVVDPTDASKYDDVKVKVEKGAVTITAEGAGSYYFGEEIKLSGTNTDSEDVYLFMTGPNLGKGDGVSILNTSKSARNDLDGAKKVSVESDDTWKYTWNTGEIQGGVLSEGSYTIYAVSSRTNKDGNVYKGNLADVEYATFSVNLRKGFITAATNVNTLAKGDDLKITGTAEGKPNQVYVWIFGKNFYGQDDKVQVSETVEDDGTFEYKLDNTESLASGQYFVIVQHPMALDDNDHNVYWDSSKLRAPGMNAVDLKGLQASEAATAVINAMDSANVDDTYTKLTFMVEDAWVRIDSIGDKAVGEKFTITGTTNLAVGNDLFVDVTSAAFGAAKKTETSGFSSSAGNVKVVEGTDFNKWSFEVDATNYKPDQYQVKVEGVDVTDATATATFNVVEAPATTVQPTGSVTTVQPTQTATTTVPATTPTQPGFGALISLIGLGAVAFLVMRRN
jgi:PGF-CTERM protein